MVYLNKKLGHVMQSLVIVVIGDRFPMADVSCGW